MDESNMPKNCFNDVWYMKLTIIISTIKKYNILPRVATGLYSSRAKFIFSLVSAAICNLDLTSIDVILVIFNTFIKSRSSTKAPFI